MYEALQKNLKIITAMAEHQKKELKILRRQNVLVQERFAENNRIFKKVEGDLKSARIELDYYRQKDAEFADADKAADEFKGQIQDLEKDIERLQADVENADFQNRVLKKEVD